MYSIGTDNELKKDGQMCYCVNGETSCTAMCAAFEELAKGRITLHCVGRNLIAQREQLAAAAAVKETDPLADLTPGLEDQMPLPPAKTPRRKGGKK